MSRSHLPHHKCNSVLSSDQRVLHDAVEVELRREHYIPGDNQQILGDSMCLDPSLQVATVASAGAGTVTADVVYWEASGGLCWI